MTIGASMLTLSVSEIAMPRPNIQRPLAGSATLASHLSSPRRSACTVLSRDLVRALLSVTDTAFAVSGFSSTVFELNGDLDGASARRRDRHVCHRLVGMKMREEAAVGRIGRRKAEHERTQHHQPAAHAVHAGYFFIIWPPE